MMYTYLPFFIIPCPYYVNIIFIFQIYDDSGVGRLGQDDVIIALSRCAALAHEEGSAAFQQVDMDARGWITSGYYTSIIEFSEWRREWRKRNKYTIYYEKRVHSSPTNHELTLCVPTKIFAVCQLIS